MENLGEALEGLFEGRIEKVGVGILFLKEAGDGGTIGDFMGVVAGNASHERLVGAFGNLGGGHDRDGVGGTFGKVGGAVDWIEGDIKAGGLGSPFAESISKKNTWGVILNPFADDHFTADIDEIEDSLNGIAGGGIGGVLISLANKAHGVERRILRRANKFKFYSPFWIIHKPLSVRM